MLLLCLARDIALLRTCENVCLAHEPRGKPLKAYSFKLLILVWFNLSGHILFFLEKNKVPIVLLYSWYDYRNQITIGNKDQL